MWRCSHEAGQGVGSADVSPARSVDAAPVREVTLVERLTALDASFLYLEEPGTPMHVGAVLVLECPSGTLDHDALIELAFEPVTGTAGETPRTDP